MSTEITLSEPQGGQITMALARALAQAEMLPRDLRNHPSDVLLIMLTGRDLGIPPMLALNLIYVVDHRPTLSAKLQLALLRRAGHKVEEVEVSAEKVVLRGTHRVTGDVITATYTWEEAEAATFTSWEGEGRDRKKVTRKLVEKDNWQYREAMLYARCSSRLATRLDPMATGGMYVPEDFDQRGPEVVVQAVDREPETRTDEAGTPDMFEAKRDGDIMAYAERLNFAGFSRRMTGKEIAESVAAGGWWEAVRRLEDRHRKACIDCQHIEAGFGSAA